MLKDMDATDALCRTDSSPNYTAAQKFPFKIAKQATMMIPDIIAKSCTYTNSVTMPVYWVFYC